MPSFADSIFLFVLALLLFGPKKLPVLARELGKWMGEFRRASNEFKMQMEEELRASEQADRQKQIAAMEAAAPVPPPLGEPEEPEHPHLRYGTTEPAPEPSMLIPEATEAGEATAHPEAPDRYTAGSHTPEPSPAVADAPAAAVEPPNSADGTRPLPIATSGSLKMMPPATGLPTARGSRPNALAGLVDSIPEAPGEDAQPPSAAEAEGVAHGD
jgi:sec-independent protein translocase protein TatB